MNDFLEQHFELHSTGAGNANVAGLNNCNSVSYTAELE